jgi:hypothetical protein
VESSGRTSTRATSKFDLKDFPTAQRLYAVDAEGLLLERPS